MPDDSPDQPQPPPESSEGNTVAPVTRHLRQAHENSLWTLAACVALGLWLMSSPVSMGYTWTPIGWSELITGLLVIVLAKLAVSPERAWASWALAGLGVWLLFAPLALWAESEAAYLNSTFSGIVLIALAVVASRRFWSQPVNPAIPPGWSFNPSSWIQRTPIIALAWLCFVISRYLTGYQLDYTDRAWDPFFGGGTERVLDSEVAEAWPISDAGLGAMAYALEALIGGMGGPSRWRTAPWVVALFGILVVPAGVVSIVLIILQPVAVGDWCTLCLVTAVAMLIMACLTLPEVAAMVQFLVQRRRAGQSVMRAFWHGGELPDAHEETAPLSLTAPVGQVWRGMMEGVSLPWSLLASLAAGLWIMLAPPIFGIENPAANSHFLTGWLIITVTVLAMADVARALRWVNVLLAGWIIVTPWLFDGTGDAGLWNAVGSGIVLIVLCIPRGHIDQQYGEWHRWII